MDELSVPVSAFGCDVLRSAFKKSVIEENIPEDQWREYASQMIRDFTGTDMVDPDLVEWIIGPAQGCRSVDAPAELVVDALLPGELNRD
jgi:hypothetical protein